MTAVVSHGPKDYRLDEVDVPVPGSGEALVKVEAVGICASDLKCYHGAPKFWGDDTRPAWTQTLVVPGHEFVGRVVQVDDEGRRNWGVDVGDRVVSEQIVPCWTCFYCRRGEYWLCEPHDIYGFKRSTPGAMAPYMVFPARALVHQISEHLAPAHAAFAEPLSCALHAVGLTPFGGHAVRRRVPSDGGRSFLPGSFVATVFAGARGCPGGAPAGPLGPRRYNLDASSTGA
ncbi:MAG TPA: alcohol dehydrogenase catalytic domain-containing protein [Gemmatimonadales bacterium]|nr:alcohol dehydrogenase catalytic domain-containing protein [Gemmatimonadales bacterium]